MSLRHLTAWLLITIPLAFAGCQPGSSTTHSTAPSSSHDAEHGDHEHGDHEHAMPSSFAAGLAEVEKYYQAIAAAYDANEPAKAEESLHEIGHALENLPKVAEKEGMTGDSLAKLKAATRTIFDACYALDSAIHEGKPGDFASVKQPLLDALSQLKSLVEPKTESK